MWGWERLHQINKIAPSVIFNFAMLNFSNFYFFHFSEHSLGYEHWYEVRYDYTRARWKKGSKLRIGERCKNKVANFLVVTMGVKRESCKTSYIRPKPRQSFFSILSLACFDHAPLNSKLENRVLYCSSVTIKILAMKMMKK